MHNMWVKYIEYMQKRLQTHKNFTLLPIISKHKYTFKP